MPNSIRSWTRWPVLGALGLAMVILVAMLLTSPSPWVQPTRAATAVQVEAGRSAFRQVRRSRETGRTVDLHLGRSDLDSIAALINQGFPPHRLAVNLRDGTLQATVSRPLWVRWLNVRATGSGNSTGFPHVQLTVGAVHFPVWLSEIFIDAARWVLSVRGVRLPPLDSVIQSSAMDKDSVRTRVLLPRTGLIDQAVGDGEIRLNPAAVARIYCRLTTEQDSAPAAAFSEQLKRAVTASAPTPEEHGAALVALAMLVVDPMVGELVGDARDRVGKCIIPPVETTLQERTDWPKHWSLSAALTVTAGHPLAIALGEWKELSDSLSAQEYLGAGDRSGFSLADLAADRSGYLTARALLDPTTLTSARARLLEGKDEMLLPLAVTRLGDGMSNAEFVRRFGATDDPRFASLVREIDSELARVQKR